MKSFYTCLEILSLATLMACSGGKKETNTSEITYHGDTAIINEQSPISQRLKIQQISEVPFSSEFRTVGTVQAETGKFAEVVTPYDGKVTRSVVRLGDNVRAGQCLFEMSSADFSEATKNYFQSVRNYEKSQADYLRKKKLLEHGIISQRELDEVFTEAENARSEKEASEAALRVFNINPANVKMGQPLRICSPIDGEIVASTITPGQFVKADSDPMVTIANLQKVWVTAQIKEHYLGAVSLGGITEIYMDAVPDKVIQGKVINIGNMVDEETRSVQVTLSCDNADRLLKHGMFVSVHFIAEPRSMVVVPSTAIFQGEQRNYVFIATEKPNIFVRRQVELGSASDDNLQQSIVKGLESGEKIVAEGGLYLND